MSGAPVQTVAIRPSCAAERRSCLVSSRALRVLFVIPGEAKGSSMIFAVRQAESLRREGVIVRQFHLRSRTSPFLLLREWLRFRRENSEFVPDVVHAHFGTMTAMFAACAAFSSPLVITFRGSDLHPVPRAPDGRGFRSWLRSVAGRTLSQLAALRARKIICVSKPLRQRLWWKRDRVTVLPSGVDTTVFFPESQERSRRELGWDTGETVILFNAGHDARIKRLDLARDAVEVARRLIPSLRLEVLDGSIPPERVPLFMNAADCLLLTSDSEGSPTVVQEALACNLPVVSVNVGDAEDRLHGVRSSRIVARDPVALGSALAEIVREGARGDGARKVSGFCADYVTQELLRLYASICRAGVAPQ